MDNSERDAWQVRRSLHMIFPFAIIGEMRNQRTKQRDTVLQHPQMNPEHPSVTEWATEVWDGHIGHNGGVNQD
jgi:hypothetical protein